MGLQSRFCFLLLLLPLCVFAAERHISAEIVEPADEKQSADLTGSTAVLPAQSEQFRMDFWKKIRRGTAVRKDYDACKNFLEHLESDKQNRQFCILLYILLAQYHRTIDREPVKSLEILAPFILEPETASQWITKQRTAAQEAFEDWAGEIKSAKQTGKKRDETVKRPEGLFVDFPSAEQWKINDSTAAVCIETARNLAVLNRQDEALNIVDTVGTTCDKEYKILAAECAADIMAWTKMYDRAIEFYTLALQFFKAMRENGDEHFVFTSDEQQIIKNRIYYKLGAIRKLVEQGHFTPDWLAYRDAQRKHLDEESLLEAYWMYLEAVKNYPDTLSAEASECYVIKVLTYFSNPAYVKEAAKRYDVICGQLEDAKSQLRQAKRTGVAMPFRIGLEAYIERLAYCVKMFEKTPFGKEALKEAEERAEKFLTKNKYGLYRGEVLLDVGAACLVSMYDLENGEKWLNHAAEWFDNAEKFDKELKEFELPDNVRKISIPPKEERYKDRWTNVKLSQPKAGDFFNRRTCAWYCNSKKKDIVLLQGLIEFAKEDYAGAEKHWDKLSELDKEFYTQQKAAGWENATTLARLTWNLKNQKGSLYATPEEMASFKGAKSRLAVILADLAIENEDFKLAEKRFKRILIDKLLCTSNNERAYCTFGLAVSLACQFKKEEAMKLLDNFAPNKVFNKSVTTPRALLYYGGMVGLNLQDIEAVKRSHIIYKYIIKNYRQTVYADRAEFAMCFQTYSADDFQTAKKLFQEYLQMFPNGENADIATELLNPDARDEWDSFLKNIKEHEEGHEKIITDYVAERNKLNSIENEFVIWGCTGKSISDTKNNIRQILESKDSIVKQHFNEIENNISQEIEQRQNDYDAKTNHGTTQGATFDSNIPLHRDF